MIDQLIQQALFSLDPETAHDLLRKIAKVAPRFALANAFQTKFSSLACRIGETALNSPIGLAAGFDKNAEMIDFLLALGFGFVELGSVSAEACSGRQRPRIFRLKKDTSLINRMGLPNDGAQKISQRVHKHDKKSPIGINVVNTPGFAKTTDLNAIEELMQLVNGFHQKAGYLTLNLSCPNSDDGKTFENLDLFLELTNALHELKQSAYVKIPVLAKLSPDLSDKDFTAIVEAASKKAWDGLVISNTTTTRPKGKTNAERIKKIGAGGLSGALLLKKANGKLKLARQILGPTPTIIGVGGITKPEDAIEKFLLGANLVQVYTGFIYGGPSWLKDLHVRLDEFVQEQGLKSFHDIIGKEELLKEI
ncbi:MAG: quinone-dependent dihydroorotate dehydrogenase [Deltaproteobacteria bacterium]|nr:quinone-dependent dihydroorotate dehydrogenase [Deltaproteobacteria bacterium]